MEFNLELGVRVGNTFKLSESLEEILDSISIGLCNEDKSRRSARRILAGRSFTQTNILPALLAVACPENEGEHGHLFSKVLSVLVNMTTPVECLMASHQLKSTEEGLQIIHEIELHLFEVKNAFLDPKVSKVVLIHAEKLLNKDSPDSSSKDLRTLNDCITLARNILHIPDEVPVPEVSGKRSEEAAKTSNITGNNSSPVKQVKRQNQILWNLFAHNLDSVVIKLITSPNLPHWSTSLMQLIALVYKDQHVHKLERLLNDWLETSLSESSEDNESNTSPQDQNGSCSSPALTSADPTDDSSDGRRNRKHSSCNAEISSSDSGNEREKCDESKKTVATNTNGSSTHHISKGSSSSHHSSKDADMRSDSSDSCSKEPPCKKAAMNGGQSMSSKKHESSGHLKRSSGSNDSGQGIDSDLYYQPTNNSETKSSNLKRSNYCEQDSGISSPHSNRDASTITDKSTDSGSSICESCSCITSDCHIPESRNNIKSSSNGGNSTEFEFEAQNQIKTNGSSEQQESNSTSSNEEDVDPIRNKTPHTCLQKPRTKKKVLTPAQTRELKRKKLIQRAKSNRMKVKALVHHIPTDDDIADLLKEFTVDFLLKGYSCLVMSLHKQLLSDSPPTMDKSHFLWLITYFLKFASQLEVELEQIGPLLSVETLTYLIFEGVNFCEEFELALREHKSDLKPHLRRLHLLVTALHEFIETLKTYSQSTHFSKEVREPILKVVHAACQFYELRQLFLLLIRRYNPAVQTRQYLSDLISSNNSLLVMIETTCFDPEVISNHLSQFATLEVMRQYGLVLEDFHQNSEELNDSVFTMMHHVSGDLNSPESLFIPQILQTFSDIWEQDDIDICDDWADLIEYVIQKFVTIMGTNPHACASNLLESSGTKSTSVDENGFTKSQLENLYWYYSQFENADDPVGAIIEIYKRTCSVAKTRLSVIQALLSQGIITLAQYMSLMYMKSVLSSCKAGGQGSVIAEVGSEHCDSDGHDTDLENCDDLKGQNVDQIDVLKDLLINQGKSCLLSWLQQVLLDACYAKLSGTNIQTPDGELLEPVPHYYNNLKQSIPMIPWNKQQEMGLQSEAFILLLHKLGIHLPADVGKCFPRIPHFWSADHIYQLAQKLGPIRKDKLKIDLSVFDSSGVNSMAREDSLRSDSFASLCCRPRSSSIPSESPVLMEGIEFEETTFALPIPTHSWIQQTISSKRNIQILNKEICFSALSRSSSSDSLSESSKMCIP